MKLNKRYVIVQAGGKGSRLEHYCWNKPKCLVPINGSPMLYSLFDRFSEETEFIVIGNHQFGVLERMLAAFPPSRAVKLVRGSVAGTIDGVAAAMKELPDDETPFLLVWSDIYFEERPTEIIEAPNDRITVAVTHSFSCRWQLDANGKFEERRGTEEGIFGLFKVPNRRWLDGLPPEGGELVRWLSSCGKPVSRVYFEAVKEYGTLEALYSCWGESSFCRFFNEVSIEADTVVKRAKFADHANLIRDELNWYQFVQQRGYQNVPKVLGTEPMKLTRINGKHPFDFPNGFRNRIPVLENIFSALKQLHDLAEPKSADQQDIHQVYVEKTLQRISVIRVLMPELASKPVIQVNGYRCKNPLHPDNDEWFRAIASNCASSKFTVIHGDPTFSNTLVTDSLEVRFIDPRGSFGRTKVYGDPLYDWAKVYYSVVGGYDQFNRRQFTLSINPDDVEITIRNSGWTHLGGFFETHFSLEELRSIKVLHGLIWLGLAGYVKDDYDSIIGAFCKGILELKLATE